MRGLEKFYCLCTIYEGFPGRWCFTYVCMKTLKRLLAMSVIQSRFFQSSKSSITSYFVVTCLDFDPALLNLFAFNVKWADFEIKLVDIDDLDSQMSRLTAVPEAVVHQKVIFVEKRAATACTGKERCFSPSAPQWEACRAKLALLMLIVADLCSRWLKVHISNSVTWGQVCHSEFKNRYKRHFVRTDCALIGYWLTARWAGEKASLF